MRSDVCETTRSKAPFIIIQREKLMKRFEKSNKALPGHVRLKKSDSNKSKSEKSKSKKSRTKKSESKRHECL